MVFELEICKRMSYFVYEFILKMPDMELTGSAECEYNKQTRMCFGCGKAAIS